MPAEFPPQTWLRLPKPKERCAVTGLSRSTLLQIVKSEDPISGENRVMTVMHKQSGARRGLLLINRESLLAYFNEEARRQGGLRFAEHVHNPENHSVDAVLSDIDLYRSFVSDDVPEEAWLTGNLSTRAMQLDARVRSRTLNYLRTIESRRETLLDESEDGYLFVPYMRREARGSSA